MISKNLHNNNSLAPDSSSLGTIIEEDWHTYLTGSNRTVKVYHRLWGHLLELAVEYGWCPMGTIPNPAHAVEDIFGDGTVTRHFYYGYSLPYRQTVVPEDAVNLATSFQHLLDDLRLVVECRANVMESLNIDIHNDVEDNPVLVETESGELVMKSEQEATVSMAMHDQLYGRGSGQAHWPDLFELSTTDHMIIVEEIIRLCTEGSFIIQ